MRARFRVTGGIATFPGLSAPRTVDIDALDPAARTSFQQLLVDAAFFDLPARHPPLPGAADYQSYEITVEDGKRRHTVLVPEPVTNPRLQALIARLRELTARPS